jgi:hypothetical protein
MFEEIPNPSNLSSAVLPELAPSGFDSPAAYRRSAPIRGCLYKKLLGLFCPFAAISLKHKLNVIKEDTF